MDDYTFTIKTFNPYESRFPKRKVLDLGAMHLVKELRKQGHKVKVLPDDGKPVDYIFRKGQQDVFNFILPFVLTVWQELPKEIVLSTISDWCKSKFLAEKRKPRFLRQSRITLSMLRISVVICTI